MKRRRAGFTLMEVIVAITITALVAAVAAASLRAGIDVRERVMFHRSTVDAEARATEWLAMMLRHPADASAVNEPLFIIGKTSTGNDSVVFVSKGVESTAGIGRMWRVSVFADASGLHLHSQPIVRQSDASGTAVAEMESVLPHITSFRAEALNAASAGREWLREWPVLRSVPVAVRFSMETADKTSREPLVLQLQPLSAGGL